MANQDQAPEFAEYTASTGYPERFIDLMDVEPYWTVLDMACGGGTLAVPFAEKVKAIVAVDFSSNMLSIVRDRCRNCPIPAVVTGPLWGGRRNE